MIKLTKIRLINWHYLSNETIEVKDNILLTGQNGSGKSTILDAITYILTGGDTSFNTAANEKSRDLKGYVKGKLGTEEQEYLRNGDVTGHIALEFHNETTDQKFICGAVIEAVGGDQRPATGTLYRINKEIDDSMFLGDRGHIYTCTEFKRENKGGEFYSSKNEAKRGFRNAFGSISDNYFKLLIKALAFKPIKNVKDFIYQNILEEKPIDVQSIQESIRAYKELENTLNVIKKKIADLKEIDGSYQAIVEFEEQKNYYEYLMKLIEAEKIKAGIENSKAKIKLLEEQKAIKEADLGKLNSEKEGYEERRQELHQILSNSEEFKAEEFVEKQLEKAKEQYEKIKDSSTVYAKKAAELKDSVNELRKINNKKIYAEIANLPLSNVSNFDSEKVKLSLMDVESRLKTEIANINQEKGALGTKRQGVIEDVKEIAASLKDLDNNKLRYDSRLLALRNDIALGLKNVYGFDVSVHFLAELLEITDKNWADTIEIFLRNRRFAMIVEPKYYDTALGIFNRIKRKYNTYISGLVNTKQIAKFTDYEENSLASIITSENVDAEHYINFTCGKVIMCENEYDLENYQTAITNDGLLYSGYMVTALNPNIDKPFIGAGAVQDQKDIWNQKAKEKQAEYYALNQSIENLDRELQLISNLDFKALVNELDNAVASSTLQEKIKDLQKKKASAQKLGVNDVKDEYNKLGESIKNVEQKKVDINQEIGGIRISVGQQEEAIAHSTELLDNYDKSLKELSKDNILIENKADAEFKEISKSSNPDKAMIEYQAKLNDQEELYRNQSDAILKKQFDYVNAYNSTLAVGLTEIKKYLAELDKLEKSELIKYEKKVRTAREDAEIVFKEDFLSKLRNNILSAEQEIGKINETLQTIKFGSDSYEFIFPKSEEYSVFYDMVTNADQMDGASLFTVDFTVKYEQQLDELFTSLAQDELNSNGAMNKFTDYRTYMDYDIKITNGLNQTMLYSKVFKDKSGGETQTPFYVAIIAAFVRVFQNNKAGVKDTIGMVLFDEVFDKMDPTRMRAMMKFIASMPIQLMLACPQSPEKIDILKEYTNTTLLMTRKGTKAQAVSIIDKTAKNVSEEDYSMEA